jgi:hypothetical protein
MDSAMKPTFRLFRRNRVYYAHHNETGQQESLRTADKCGRRRDFP